MLLHATIFLEKHACIVASVYCSIKKTGVWGRGYPPVTCDKDCGNTSEGTEGGCMGSVAARFVSGAYLVGTGNSDTCTVVQQVNKCIHLRPLKVPQL